MADAYAPDRFAPAPSYAIESDSEQELEWDELNRVVRPSRKRRLPGEPRLSFDGKGIGSLKSKRRAVVLVGEAGERVRKRVACERVAVIKLGADDDDEVDLIGSIHTTHSDDVLCFLDPVVPLHHQLAVARAVLDLLPTNVDVLATYHLPSYMSSESSDKHEPLIRRLSSSTAPSKSSALPFSSPNLIQGLPAAIFSALASSHASSTPSEMWLLPSTAIPPPLSSSRSRLVNAPRSSSSTASYYDAGGPTDLSTDPDALFASNIGRQFERIANENGWDAWWNARSTGKDDPLVWLETERKRRRKAYLGSMYM